MRKGQLLKGGVVRTTELAPASVVVVHFACLLRVWRFECSRPRHVLFYENKSFVNSSAGSGAAAVTSQILQHHHHPILPAGNAVQCDLKKFWSPTGFQNPQQLSHAARWCFHPKLGNVASVIARASELSRPFSNSFFYLQRVSNTLWSNIFINVWCLMWVQVFVDRWGEDRGFCKGGVTGLSGTVLPTPRKTNFSELCFRLCPTQKKYTRPVPLT